MYLAHNERKYVVAERFIKTWKNQIYKYIYIDKLDNIVNKYNNTYQNTVKMKPVDVKANTLIITLVKRLMIDIID